MVTGDRMCWGGGGFDRGTPPGMGVRCTSECRVHYSGIFLSKLALQVLILVFTSWKTTTNKSCGHLYTGSADTQWICCLFLSKIFHHHVLKADREKKFEGLIYSYNSMPTDHNNYDRTIDSQIGQLKQLTCTIMVLNVFIYVDKEQFTGISNVLVSWIYNFGPWIWYLYLDVDLCLDLQETH